MEVMFVTHTCKNHDSKKHNAFWEVVKLTIKCTNLQEKNKMQYGALNEDCCFHDHNNLGSYNHFLCNKNIVWLPTALTCIRKR